MISKKEFLRIAPIFYALAIAAYFKTVSSSAYRDEFFNHYFEPERWSDDGPEADYQYLAKPILFDEAMKWLLGENMVEILADPFGPTVYKSSDQFDQQWQQLLRQNDLPFAKYEKLSSPMVWLKPALRNLNDTFEKLGIDREDFETSEEDWEPLPLEQANPKLIAAVQAIEKTISEVRANNGYAATVPQERDYVLEALGRVSDRLKHGADVSVGFLRRYAIEPLSIVVKRFNKAATGLTAAAAREAVVDLIKEYGEKFVEFLIEHL